MWAIQHIEEPELFWSNLYGWTDHLPEADIFTDDERQTLNLPMGGQWRLMGGE